MNPSGPAFLSLIAAGSALSGSLLGIIGNALVERGKYRRTLQDTNKARAIAECETFFAHFERSMEIAQRHLDQYRDLPGDREYSEGTTGGPEKFLPLELHCSKPIRNRATALVKAADAWAFHTTGTWDACASAKLSFISEFRKLKTDPAYRIED